MIKAYLTCITTLFEGEDIEIRYSIFKDEELIKKESYFKGYEKPALCQLVAMEELLKELKDYSEETIVVVVNDGALLEMLEGRSRVKNLEEQNLGRKIRKILEDFPGLRIENVTGDHIRTKEWNDILSR